MVCIQNVHHVICNIIIKKKDITYDETTAAVLACYYFSKVHCLELLWILGKPGADVPCELSRVGLSAFKLQIIVANFAHPVDRVVHLTLLDVLRKMVNVRFAFVKPAKGTFHFGK